MSLLAEQPSGRNLVNRNSRSVERLLSGGNSQSLQQSHQEEKNLNTNKPNLSQSIQRTSQSSHLRCKSEPAGIRNRMNGDNQADDTYLSEYHRSFAWRSPLSSSNPREDFSKVVNKSEYTSAFAWPPSGKSEAQPVAPVPANVSKSSNTLCLNGDDAHMGVLASRQAPVANPSSEKVPVSSAKTIPVTQTVTVTAAGLPSGAVLPPAVVKKSATFSKFGDTIGKPYILFNLESAPVSFREDKTKKKSEYNSKFRPFSQYVYLEGNGFLKSKHLDKGDSKTSDKANVWYKEVSERCKQANEYRVKSLLGHPVCSDNLNEIYSRPALWQHQKDRTIAALALATTQALIVEKKREREELAIGIKNHHVPRSAPVSLSRDRESRFRSQSAGRPKSSNKSTPNKSKSKKIESKSGLPETVDSRGKVWLKPKKAETTGIVSTATQDTRNKNVTKKSTETGQKSPRPTTLNMANQGKELPTGPIKTTTIRSPEEITGTKSPPPESWSVPLNTQDDLNWINGQVSHTPATDASTAKPLTVTVKGKVTASKRIKAFKEMLFKK